MNKYTKAFGTFVLLGIIPFSFAFLLNEREAENPKRSIPPLQKYSDITSDKLKERLNNKDFYFINVHVPYEGEIEKTDIFIPYDQIDNNLDKLPKDKKAKIVLYCKTGRMSALAGERLTELGYTNVENLSFGMHDWQSKGYQLIFNP